MAEMVTASGDAVEMAQMVIDPAERRARDDALRVVFADPGSRHHEAVAEAELDIDYGGSPIVMGDKHEALRRASASRIRSRSVSPTARPACCTSWPTEPATRPCSSVAGRLRWRHSRE